MDILAKAAQGAVTGVLGGDSGKGPSTITLEGGAAKAAALAEQAKHQLSVERITNSRQLQSAMDSFKRSEERNHDSEKEKKVLEKARSTLEQQNMVGEAKYEQLKADKDRLRDELQREVRQHQRDKEDQRMHHENAMENVRLNHAREMDREKKRAEDNTKILQGSIKEKEDCISKLQSELEQKDGELAQLDNMRIQQLRELMEQLENNHSRKVAELEREQDDMARRQEIEMKGLQEEVNMLNKRLDDSEKDCDRKLEQQRKATEDIYGEAIDALKSENKRLKKENERVLNQKGQKHRQDLDDLDDKMKKMLTNERENHKLKIKELDFEKEREREDLGKKIDELEMELENLSRDSTQKLKEKEHEHLTKIANLEKDLTLRMEQDKSRKLQCQQEEYQMKLERRKQENEFQVKNLEFQIESGQEKLKRAIDRSHEQERQRRDLEDRLRESDLRMRLRMREEIQMTRDDLTSGGSDSEEEH